MSHPARHSPDPEAYPDDADLGEQARHLLEYAVLAPSSHNSQPWAFDVDGGTIRVFADTSRQLDVADPTGRELAVSVGCAVENLVVAAVHFDRSPLVEYVDASAPMDARPTADADAPDRYRHLATVHLEAGTTDSIEGAPDEALFDAIPVRRTNHGSYDDRPLPAALRETFQATGDALGVDVHVVTDPETKDAVAALQARADETLFDDPTYRAELAEWIRSGALGAGPIRARVSATAVRRLDLGDREGRKNATRVENAPAVVALATATDNAPAWLRVGRAFERMALAATGAGVAVHPLSQVLELPALRDQFAELLDTESTPQHLFRAGYADPDGTTTPRRPVDDVLLSD
ncbi:Acg family FMN-binding oxidoreductase [Halorubellus salinus]|uniref:Acg family FMN-binding oxidoreductase n=1 Tax=Halorubellus salinus TaxID=755309 RepID=UPI001D07D684|nr:nitroreductase family protein [Halorubellus salinus]